MTARMCLILIRRGELEGLLLLGIRPGVKDNSQISNACHAGDQAGRHVAYVRSLLASRRACFQGVSFENKGGCELTKCHDAWHLRLKVHVAYISLKCQQ
jgi:hypothetical protein